MRRLRTTLAAVVVVAALGPFSQAGAVSSADEICTPMENPCLIGNTTARKYTVDDGADLDFGTRHVIVSGNNSLDFGSGFATLRCGQLTVDAGATQTPFLVRGPDAFGDISGGFVQIEARRSCSEVTSRSCVRDGDCNLGLCSSRTCSGNPNRVCTQDANCQVGVCAPNLRCSAATTIRCTSNADCDLGSCGSQLHCNARLSEACDADSDCYFGTCSIGTGSIDFDGKLAGQGVDAAVIVMRAADDIRIRKSWNLNGTTVESDGGEMDIQSYFGRVSIEANQSLVSGGDSEGGTVALEGGTNVDVVGNLDCNGGDFDGGSVELTAGQDVNVSGDLLCNSISGEGGGGFIEVTADRDANVGEASGTTNLGTKGHEGIENFGGDGGSIDIIAERIVNLGASIKAQGNGATPDGFGSDVFVEGGESVVMDGDFQARADGNFGGGGFAQIESSGTLVMHPTAKLDFSGGDSGGGTAEFLIDGNATVGGTVDVRSIVVGGENGVGGTITFESDADIDVSGSTSLLTNGAAGGAADGSVNIEACRTTVRTGASIANQNLTGDNTFVVRESMRTEAGSSVTAPVVGGTNTIRYRAASKPPVLGGTMTPSPVLVVDALNLVPCPVCGNGELDGGELCEDGNLTNGDGCSSECIPEGCIDDTPGYPAVSLCDDGNACTQDSCNPDTDACENVFLCDDGIDCTVDACIDDQCANTPNHDACDDADECTDDICSAVTGCGHTDNTSPCEDGLFCTVGDSCLEGDCLGGPARDCSDGVGCTTDSCDEDGDQCVSTPDDGACDNGLFCDGVETCDTMADCMAGVAVDCSDLDGACTVGVCDDDSDGCVSAADNETGACDDGDACTENDMCSSGVCVGAEIPGCRCGDGNLDYGEECDDGNTTDGDGCSAACVDELCGDGLVNNVSEECDDGASNSDVVPDACRTDCRDASCGDAVTDSSEDCDDGGESAACDADCTAAACGDGTINTTAGETCDDSGESADCDADCTAVTCGDGTTNATAGETCDDSGESADCDADCTAVTCGDGTTNATAGETCDDSGESAECDADCTAATCGDGTTNAAAGEACDDGNLTSGDGCDADCSVTACGNGIVTAGEQCDDGAGNSDTLADACRTDCTDASCGDGVTDSTEQCDDGNTTEGDGCDASCTTETTTTTSTSSTTTTTLSEPVCGDEVVEGDEACDDGDNNSNASGAYCSDVCAATPCGAPVGKKAAPSATDALYALRTAVRANTCDLRVCDVDSGGSITASDALLILRRAVNQPVTLNCTVTI